MKKHILVFLALTCLVSNRLQADMEYVPCSRWYMGAIFGVNHMNSDLDVGPQLGFSIGYRLSSSIHLEGEVSTSINQNKETGWEENRGLLMANILYNLNSRHVRPYVGFGAGSLYRSVTADFDQFHVRLVEDNTFAYQGLFGLMAPVASNALACLEYRYIENSSGNDVSQSLGLNIKRYF